MRTTGHCSAAKRSGDTAFQHGDGSAVEQDGGSAVVRGGYGTSSSVDFARGRTVATDSQTTATATGQLRRLGGSTLFKLLRTG